MARERNYYWVNCCTPGGFCYASHYNCSWKDVIRFRQIAKLLGETINYEKQESRY